MSKAIVSADVRTEGGLLAVFEEQGTDLAEVAASVSEAVGAGGMKMSDLERVKVPSGGGLSFQTDSEEIRELLGAVISDTEVRAYWKNPIGGGAQPPDCTSLDMKHGVGVPGGDCETCPMAQYGSKVRDDGKPSNAQACVHRRMLMLFTPSSALPWVLSAPPSSLKTIRQSFLRQAAGKGIRVSGALWSFMLDKTKNANGVEYSLIRANLVRRLTEGEQALVDQYRSALKGLKPDLVRDDTDEA